MAEELRQKTVRSLVWNGFDKVGFQLVACVVGIITARLIAPAHFGLIGALSVFTLLSNALVESGFTATLVRRPQNTAQEYTAAFYFNTALSVVLYLLLYFTAPAIARYFRQDILCPLARYLFLSVIINAFGLVQTISLTRSFKFKHLSLINFTAAVSAGALTLFLAWRGYGPWALATQVVCQSFVRVALLWVMGSWKPCRKPRFAVISEVFSFSAVMLLTSLLNIFGKSLYNLIIGRRYSMKELGYFSQAQKYQQVPVIMISQTVTGVAYPVLSTLNSQPERWLFYMRKWVRILSFLVFPALLGLYAIARDFIVILVSDVWLPAVPYFKLLLVSGLFYPFHSLYLNALTVRGGAKWYFYLELLRNILVITSLFLGLHSIDRMLLFYACANGLSFIVDALVLARETTYRCLWQLRDMAPYFVLSLVMVLIVKLVALVPMGIYARVGVQIIVACLFYCVTLRLLGSTVFSQVLDLLKTGRIK